MKSQKGVTLASLAIYIVIIFIVLAILATVTANMQGNVRNAGKEGTGIAEINKFNMYFLKEVKKQGNTILPIEEENIITFSSGVTFEYDSNNKVINYIEKDNNGNIQKSITISKDIQRCTFASRNENEKTIITVTIEPKNVSETIIEYVLGSGLYAQNYENENDYIRIAQVEVTLSSIAVTTPPNKTSYYVGETFDTSGMVVTATWSDNSTSEVTNYTYSPDTALTLSDTVITITYTIGDVTQTTTQAITVLSRGILPSGYVAVEYIEGTGAQYIDTNYNLTNNSTFELDYELTAQQYGAGIYGAYINGTSRYEGITRRSNQSSKGNLEYGYYNAYPYDISQDLARHVIKQDKEKFYYDGVLKRTFTNASFTQSLTAYIGYIHISSSSYSPMIGKIYSCKIYENDELVRDFVPCYRVSDGKPGLYDLVNGVFYTNQGTGADFTLGPVKYAKEGLTLWLDGINKGDTAGKWIDQASDLEFTMAGTYTLEDTSVHFTNGKAETSTIINPVTLEFVMKNEYNRYGTLFYNNINGHMVVFNNYSYIQIGGRGKSYPSTGNTIINYSIIYDGSNNVYKCYRNGELQTQAGSIETWGGTYSGTRIGQYNNNYPFVGDVYCIRAYNRELTEAEIISNYNIDRQRFGF